jgi:hypothetical protein
MGRRISNDLLCKAIAKAGGYVADAVKIVGCDNGVFHRRERERGEDGDKYRACLEAARLNIVDNAESGLAQLVEDGNVAAIIFTLKCHGRQRGWIERIESCSINLNFTSEDLQKMNDDDFYDLAKQLQGQARVVLESPSGGGETPAKKRKGTYLGPPGANGNGRDNNGEVLPD